MDLRVSGRASRQRHHGMNGDEKGFYDERMQCKIVMHEMDGLGIDDLFVGMEVVPKVKLGYCSPFQLRKEQLVSPQT
jgi:hypothetical protein